MKHAYLILAHQDFALLETLIRLLDDPRNDLYVHIDKKVKNFDFDHFRQIPQASAIHFVPRMSVTWGDQSLSLCEIALMKAALAGGSYRYLHLLSGIDLPLKTQDQIHAFFQQNDGLEFLDFAPEDWCRSRENRVRHYHCMALHRSPVPLLRLFGKALDRVLDGAQTLLRISRPWEAGRQIAFGMNWCSITQELARYIVSQEAWVREAFRHTACSDEAFVQTLAIHSPFRDRLGPGSMRYVDWTRGNPYIFQPGDLPQLLASPCLFARKFRTQPSGSLIQELVTHLTDQDTL